MDEIFQQKRSNFSKKKGQIFQKKMMIKKNNKILQKMINFFEK